MSNVANIEPLLTKEQTCVYLKISAPTLDRWMRAGRITPINPGIKPVRFSIQSIQAALNSQPEKVAS